MKNYIETYNFKNSSIQRMDFEKATIHTNPEYQRNGGIWSLEKRQYLIDSILNDYDLPKIYFHALDKKQKKKLGKEYAIIDGRQRLEAIWGFRHGDYALSKDFKYFKSPKLNAAGMTYNEISKKFVELRIIFDSYTLPITVVETDDLDLIDDMFLRLNEAVPLNAAEKRNAIRGPMVPIINKVSNHEFFAKKVRFGNKRYQHREVAVRLLFLVHCIESEQRMIDTKKVYLDEFVRSFKKDKTLKPKPLLTKVTSVLDQMCEVFTNSDALLRAQSYVPIYFLLLRDAMYSNKNISRTRLVKFRKMITDNKLVAEEDITRANFDLLEFDRLSQQGTNDALSIKERLRIIESHFSLD